MQQINKKKNYVKLKVEKNENRKHSATNKHDLKEEKCQVSSHQHLKRHGSKRKGLLMHDDVTEPSWKSEIRNIRLLCVKKKYIWFNHM